MTTPTPPATDPNDWAHQRGHVDYPGHRFVWTLEHDGWRAATPDETATHRCRWTDYGARCPNAGAVALYRGLTGRPRWWFYCPDHLYGRHLHDGHIWTVRLVEVEP